MSKNLAHVHSLWVEKQSLIANTVIKVGHEVLAGGSPMFYSPVQLNVRPGQRYSAFEIHHNKGVSSLGYLRFLMDDNGLVTATSHLPQLDQPSSMQVAEITPEWIREVATEVMNATIKSAIIAGTFRAA